MFDSISSALGAISSMASLVKSANDIKTTSEINDVKIEMQQLIIELQGSLMQAQIDGQKIIEELDQCKKELRKIQEFKLQTDNYTQIKLETGAIIYRDIVSNVDVCAHCFSNNKISLLQPFKTTLAFVMVECPNCHNHIRYRKNTNSSKFGRTSLI